MEKAIVLHNARANNLKGIDLEIPTGKLTVVTGVSGSGKSSLAFDTLYAEGQRRYVESLSAYARQFLGRMPKPEVDYIHGLPPAIAIEQKVNTRNPRSTVGTSTEIYDYLKLLFARAGRTYSPVSGEEVRKDTPEDVVRYAVSLPEGEKIMLGAPLTGHTPEERKARLETLAAEGYQRVYHKGEVVKIAEYEPQETAETYAIIDRLSVRPGDEDFNARLREDIEVAMSEGDDACVVIHGEVVKAFSRRFERDGMRFVEPSEHLFAFNNPLGACPTCEGFGKIIGIDERLVVPNPALSVYEGAIAPWRGESMGEWNKRLMYAADRFGFPIHRPYYQLTQAEKRVLWTGNAYFEGLDAFFKYLEQNQYKIQYRVMLARYRGKTTCPTCHGTRLRPEAAYVKVGGMTIGEMVEMSVERLREVFEKGWDMTPEDMRITEKLRHEIVVRLGYLCDVGLGYLTLNRLSNSLSGGESQRINLTTSLGSGLVGSLYVLDEPSIGLHAKDTERLIGVLKKLRDAGNTVVVVEHDEDIMRAADKIVDIGPEAGSLGGEIVWEGCAHDKNINATRAEIGRSHTLRYLMGIDRIELPHARRHSANGIEIKGVTEHNLKGVSARFPLNVMTAVTGVSGSGKSTLVRGVLYPALQRYFGETPQGDVAQSGELDGSLHLLRGVEMVDQNPVGKSTRANAATYIKAYDEIRKLYGEQQLAKQLGFGASHFSFNVPGGRCEECEGDGYVTVPMQFMADLRIECEACHGKRFKPDVLEVKYRGKSIDEVLDMTVAEAVEFFDEDKKQTPKRIANRLRVLQQVGLGYIKLGQPLSTLSGGESQRVKLASFIGLDYERPTLFIFDEPTTGLHFGDIQTLLTAFDSLLRNNHTIVVIEHNLDVIQAADYVIDMGPEGGERGGEIVATGTPEEIARNPKSVTGQYLKAKLGKG